MHGKYWPMYGIKSFVPWHNPLLDGELSRTRPLLSTPTELESTQKWTELAHMDLRAVAVNTTSSSSFKVSLDISTPHCNHRKNTHIIRGRRKWRRKDFWNAGGCEGCPKFLIACKEIKAPSTIPTQQNAVKILWITKLINSSQNPEA